MFHAVLDDYDDVDGVVVAVAASDAQKTQFSLTF